MDFGTTATRDKVFTVVDAAILATSKILATQSGAAATGRSADENEMDSIGFSAQPSTGQFRLIARAHTGPAKGKYKVNYWAG